MDDSASDRMVTAVRVPLDATLFEQLEAFRRAQRRIPSRAECLRRFLALGLANACQLEDYPMAQVAPATKPESTPPPVPGVRPPAAPPSPAAAVADATRGLPAKPLPLARARAFSTFRTTRDHRRVSPWHCRSI
jgi:hypothetical protein